MKIINASEQDKVVAQMLDFIVEKLGIELMEPENEVIKQGDKAENMYFVQKGECHVTI